MAPDPRFTVGPCAGVVVQEALEIVCHWACQQSDTRLRGPLGTLPGPTICFLNRATVKGFRAESNS